MAFGSTQKLGIWGLALAASVGLHVLVIGCMFGMNGCGGASDIPELPPVPQTDGRADGLPAATGDEQGADATPAVTPDAGASRTASRPARDGADGRKRPSRPAKPAAVKPASDDKPVADTADWQPYVVKAGDSLSRLARQAGVTVQELAKANGLSPTASLMLGQSLKLPPSKK